MKNVKVLSFMAVSKGRAATEEVVAKRLQGVAAGTIEAVNPDLKTIKELFPHSQAQEEPKYVGTTTVKNSKDMDVEVPQIRIALIFKTDPAISTNNGIEATLNIPIFLAKGYSYSHKNGVTKVQVIDKYGRTAWVTIEQAKNHQIPVYSNGPARLDKDYRPAYRGEEELLKFIINWLNITPLDSYNKNTGEWMTNAHPEDCEAGLYKIPNYFKGDISELKEHCAMLPYNRLKLVVGVRTDNEGKQYGTVYTRETLRNGSTSYTRLKDSIEGNAQYLQDTVFTDDHAGIITNIHEYKENVKESDLSKPAAAEDPFAAAAALPDDDLPFGDSNDDDPFKDVA